MDAVYVLNWVVNREIRKPKEKVFVFFADLKAAFDRVDREKLEDRLKKMGVKRRLGRRVMEIYEETKNVMKVGENKSEEFWTEDG